MIHDFDPEMIATPIGTVYWYGAVYSLGFLGVFLWFWARRGLVGLNQKDVVNFSILFAAGVLVGGRLFDVFVYEFDFYRSRPLAVLNWWHGGMASHGVLLGGLIATLLFAKRRGIPVLVLLDEIVVPGAFLLAVGRLGNFIEGGVIGSVSDVPWAVSYPDVAGPRHPVALYESLKNLLLVPVLIWAIRIWSTGRGVALSLFVFLYAALRFAVDVFRDYEAVWLGIDTGQVFNLAMAAAGLGMLLYFGLRPWSTHEAPGPAPRSPGPVAVCVLVLLLIYPLGIPTSWTRENIAEIRLNGAGIGIDRDQ